LKIGGKHWMNRRNMYDPSKNPYDVGVYDPYPIYERQHLIVAYRRGYEQALKDSALTEQEREVFNTVMSFFSEPSDVVQS
jgi:hypothetical protein